MFKFAYIFYVRWHAYTVYTNPAANTFICELLIIMKFSTSES